MAIKVIVNMPLQHLQICPCSTCTYKCVLVSCSTYKNTIIVLTNKVYVAIYLQMALTVLSPLLIGDTIITSHDEGTKPPNTSCNTILGVESTSFKMWCDKHLANCLIFWHIHTFFHCCKNSVKIPTEVIRSRKSKAKGQKDKQWCTKHYTENQR